MRACNVGSWECPGSPSVHAGLEPVRDKYVVYLTFVNAIRVVPGHYSRFLVFAKGVCNDKVVLVCKFKES